MRQHQQRRQGWLEANAHLGPQYRQVVRTLAWQRRATGLAVEQNRPDYVLDALGPVPASTRGRRAWRHAAAEIEQDRRTARVLAALERHGWAVLHDLAVPRSRANIDHLVIGPGGVFVIDSKQYRGRLQLDPTGRLWHGRYPLAPARRAVSFEADQAALVLTDPDVVVIPILAVHGTQVPWGKVVADGVPVVVARRLPSMLRQLPAVLGPERVAWLADRARFRFRLAA